MLRFSTDGTSAGLITTLTTQHSVDGGVDSKKIYLYNDDATKRYQNIVIDPTDISGGDESSYIQLAQDNAGSPGTYQSAGANLTMADINDTLGKPFWVKITTPSLGTTQNKTDLQLKVLYREFAV